jgi:hypothetical protein
MKGVVIKYLRDIYYVSENLNYKHSCYCPLLLTSLRTNIRQIIITFKKYIIYIYYTFIKDNNNMHYIYFYIKCIIIIFFQSLR